MSPIWKAMAPFVVRTVVAALVLNLAVGPAIAAGKADWDRADNVKAAAKQIGEIQASQGADKAFKFVTDCYRTHGLAANYSKAFEGCIAQDLMLMEALAAIYGRVDPQVLRKSGAPSVEQLQQALSQRMSGAYATYNMPASEGLALKKIVDTHGMPVFIRIVFPKAGQNGAVQSEEKKK